jgi:hypothetical protein
MFMKKSVLAGILLACIILTGLASAQVEYTGGVLSFKRGVLLQNTWNPANAQVACTPDNKECVAVLYERAGMTGYTQGLKLFHSIGSTSAAVHFQGMQFSCGGAGYDAFWYGCNAVSVPANFNVAYDSIEATPFGGEYPFPYGVTYNPSDGKFYIIFTGGTMGAAGYRSTYVYRYDRDLTAPVLVSTIANAGFNMIVNQTYFLKTQCCRMVSDSGFYNYWVDTLVCDLTGACSSTPVNSQEILHHAAMSLGCTWLHTFKGYGFSSGANLQYESKGTVRYDTNVNCPAPSNVAVAMDYFTYAGSITGSDYFDGTNFYYTNVNATYRVSTDGSSFGSPALIYQWMGNETVNHSNSYSSEKNQVYLWDRGYASNAGIYAFNKQLYAFKVQAKGLNPLSGVVEDISAVSQLVCFDQNYSYTVSGVNAVLVTPCLDNNSILISPSTGWAPSSLLISNVEVLSPTGYTFITSPANGLGFVKDYNYTLRFIDKFTSLPVQNASVTISGSTKTTNANGEVVYTLAPFDSATFVPLYIGNVYYLYLNGTLKTYDYEFSRSGYQSAIGTFRLTDVESPTAASDFKTSKSVQVEPNLLRLIADVYTNDGIHYGGDSVIVRVGGAQSGVYYDDNGVSIPRDYAITFPATFILLDNRTSWTAYLNLTQGAYFANDTVAVTNDTLLYRYTFTLPNSSVNQQCASDAGCDYAFCFGSNWKSDGRCVGGICSYDVQSCPLFCDDAAGCYADTTAVSCPSGLDIECYGSNVCADSKHLKNYKCSSDRLCVYDVVECDYMCDSDGKVCIPSQPVVLCDQSSVTGMLTCMQSGIMSFVGTTYNPMMTIGIVLFLVILIVAILGLGFRAVTSVIR